MTSKSIIRHGSGSGRVVTGPERIKLRQGLGDFLFATWTWSRTAQVDQVAATMSIYVPVTAS
jgi:hypothetical protein